MASKKAFSERFRHTFGPLSAAFESDSSRFRLFTGLKMTAIPFMSFLILVFLFTIVIKMNMHFFKANQIIGLDNFSESFYDAIFTRLSHFVPYMAGLLLFVNILSIYVSDLLLRPFNIIAEYCEKRVENDNEASYNPDLFTDLKILTRFSEYFFTYIDMARNLGKLAKAEVPKKYTKIHKPVFETTFFLQFFLFILISLLTVSVSIYAFAMDFNDQIIVLANQILGANRPAINFFLEQQSKVVDLILIGVLVTHVIMYSMLSMHLYLKIAGPAFGIFATMRSFLKGHYSARIHLIGFYYLRPQCRKINKYLDQIEKNLVK